MGAAPLCGEETALMASMKVIAVNRTFRPPSLRTRVYGENPQISTTLGLCQRPTNHS